MESNSYTFNFKSGLLTFSSFLIVVMLMSFCVEEGFKSLDSNSNIGRSISSNSDIYKDYSYLFIGDSRTHQGVDSRYFNQLMNLEYAGSYNLGRPGMQAPFSYFILRDYLENNQSTKLDTVYVQFSFYLLGGQQWMKDIYFSYYKPKIWMVSDAVSKQLVTPMEAVKWFFYPRVSLLRHRKRATGLIKIVSEKKLHEIAEIISSISETRAEMFDSRSFGYLSRGSDYIVDSDIKPTVYREGIERGYSLYFKYMKKFFDLATKYKFQIIVYDFPWPKKQVEINETFLPAHSYYKKLIKKQAENNSNVIFKEYDFLWENRYFVDPLHLNQPGAEKLTEILARWQ